MAPHCRDLVLFARPVTNVVLARPHRCNITIETVPIYNLVIVAFWTCLQLER